MPRAFFLLLTFAVTVCSSTATPAATRTHRGLKAFYNFSAPEGAVIKDRSGVGEPLDLKITNLKAVRRANGTLEVRGKTLIRSDRNAGKITEAVRESGEITIEAWIKPAQPNQEGPARIVTVSKDGSERSFTLGQNMDRFDVRFTTTETSKNGIPSLASEKKSLTTKLTHVVYTRDRSGRTQLYLDGKPVAEELLKGSTAQWTGSLKLALANEMNQSRPWLGTYHLVAIYGRDLLPHEVKRNFEAGPRGKAGPDDPAGKPKDGDLFSRHIAPLLAEHCLECHDTNTKKGKIDLSRKGPALAGGPDGPIIVPGNASDSLLWESVDADDMPKKRDPLSAAEKETLRKWIDAGAQWPDEIALIDPADYAHGEEAGAIWVQRLTVPEYIETVRRAVGVDISREARELLPPDLRADGFSNTAYNLNVDLKHVGAYAQLAGIIAGRIDVGKFCARFSKSRLLIDDDNIALIAKMGQWLLRGPLDGRETATFRGIATGVTAAGGDFDEAMGYVIEAMLQSPRFIYRVENQRGDGTDWPADDFELASRLSYILWGGPPDEKLMRAAETGKLHTDRESSAQVKRMLDDPRAVARSTQFITDWLDLDRLQHLRPDPGMFPGWSEALASDMRAETIAFFQEVVWQEKRPLADLLNAQVSHLTPRLAKHYGLEPQGDGEVRYDLSAVPSRGGVLTQGSVLTIGGDTASMVTRGLFVLHDLLRGRIKDPPPCVNTTPPATKAGLTNRGIAEQRIADKKCGGCHVKFEPLAFGLERFDGTGAYLEADQHGNRLREDGNILFPGAEKAIPYQTAGELMDLLAESARVQESLTWKVTQFALGRPLTQSDHAILKTIHADAQENGGTYPALMTAIVKSDLVRLTRTEADE